MTAPTTRLRPPRDDEELAAVRAWPPASPYEDWSGSPGPAGAEGEAAGGGAAPGSGGGELLVTDGHDRVVGSVSWRQVPYGPNPGSVALDVGISLRPDARGIGHGGRGQRLLAEYLFATTSVHRVQATTDVENAAEQRALERAGFRREGVLRGAQWRLGRHHDLVSYARLRSDDGPDD